MTLLKQQLEYLRTQGFEFISPEDIRAAQKGLKSLPKKAALLTFDDGYLSFYKFVHPLLKLYNYPAVLSIVTSWIEQKPDYVGKPLMSWEQIKEVSQSDLVHVASHSHDLHKGAFYNPAGNEGPATALFIYDPGAKKYESDDSFKKRIFEDLAESTKILAGKIGKKPWILTWPYGEFNELSIEEAKKLGFEMMLTLENGYAEVKNLERMNRNIITDEMGMRDFILAVKEGFPDKVRIRAVQIDLDKIVNPLSYEESDRNLGLLIERLVALGVNTVFLQGFCDTDGSGNIHSVYFYNNVLPVKMDFLSHAVHQIKIRGIKTYVWMPALSFELPDPALNEDLKVREIKNGKNNPTTSWYRRLSPFDPRTREIVKSIYRDLSAYVYFDGLLFQDDLYLTDEEDFHPSAAMRFRERYGVELHVDILKEKPSREKWISLKTEVLNKFSQELSDVVKRYRPHAYFARNIYSEVVHNPAAQEWFAQNFGDFLKQYDYTVIMAYPRMEGIHQEREIKEWFKRLLAEVNRYKAKQKVVFKIQSYDWGKKIWVQGKTLNREIRFLLSRGAQHVGYYPDDVFHDQPDLKSVSDLSAKTLP